MTVGTAVRTVVNLCRGGTLYPHDVTNPKSPSPRLSVTSGDLEAFTTRHFESRLRVILCQREGSHEPTPGKGIKNSLEKEKEKRDVNWTCFGKDSAQGRFGRGGRMDGPMLEWNGPRPSGEAWSSLPSDSGPSGLPSDSGADWAGRGGTEPEWPEADWAERAREVGPRPEGNARGEAKGRLGRGRAGEEAQMAELLANPVLVPRKTGQWRMCVDYTDLNKSCPKDPFGLPRIDQVIDSTADCELLNFIDCYSGYHQISLKESDYLKTSFITPFGAYCYITMPFGLKNAGATYQRMIQRCLQSQLGQNMEAYVDDVVIKTKQRDDLIADLEETFQNIWAFMMKLNPEKCTFEVPSRKLLAFMVSHRGIEANPENINAIRNMKLPRTQKDVQKLTGCMTALSRFVFKLRE
uniref:OO_Ba0013J05-OO_Ba0033A15.23 protein n=1 Tax=Oryza officinalis TaxID=4535 RepID=D0ABG6_9ORYZ|nr:OO_Ba0013J05-OO_Ba0033A15.23 [Oryza officinalis]